MTSHYNQADKNLYHAIHSDLVGELLHPPRAPATPEPVKRFRRSHYADPGIRTFHWGVANDPNDKPNQIHGTKFGTRSLLTYDSSVRHPVGSVPLRQPAIPPHLTAAGAATFGVPTKYGDTVAQCVSPFRTAAEFQAHWCKGTDLYRRSHMHLMPGEQRQRHYGPTFNGSAKFGVPTPHDPSGRKVKECVTWPGPCQPLPALVSLRAENWRELNQNRIGEPLDKFQCTRDLPSGFTHGTPMRHTLCNALDMATAAGFTSFIGLMKTMKNMDKLGTKHLPLESVLAACCEMCVPLSTAELRHLVERLNLAQGPRQLVIYALFVATLNWKDRLTLGHLECEY
ncbi:EF-hand domain-containing family member B-like [Pollicipes pollicipes]|uniref:EF-hand domain-containing family member B-like n=1 Tax=Pollicipes pollicipes TaxID=41117 RepID=UPI001884CC63|nr:EF-hand domain-containing family member B-like [Pollicipes pollicipes]